MELDASARVRIGISGWRYPPWRGVFYPRGLRQADELTYASRTFSSIEINGSFYALQRPQSYAAWCVADSAGLYPLIDDVTAGFSYFRLHGAERLYVSGYDRQGLAPWAERIRRLQSQDVYVYFDNDVKVRAPFDAQNLMRLLGERADLPLPGRLASVTEEPRSVWPAWRGTRVAKAPHHGNSKKP